MEAAELIQTSPISVEQSARGDEIRALTSCKAGVIVPLCFVPLLREDRVMRGDLRIKFDMSETIHTLLNAVNVKVMAHFISHVASERYTGLESFNRAYQGIPEPHNGLVIPFVATMPFAKAAPFWKTLGVQWPEGAAINGFPVEAYNILVNFRRRARTDKLPMRALTDVSLAEAFWKHTNMGHIVPDWDQAAMDGEVPLNFAEQFLPVIGLARETAVNLSSGSTANVAVTHKGDGPGQPATTAVYPYARNFSDAALRVRMSGPTNTAVPEIYAELVDQGVTVSLANIELAKQTAAFAKLREKFDGIDDDHIVDLLMEGIRVPDEALKQPILLDSRSSIFGYSERKAMDGENLDVSRTTGFTEVALRFRTPPMNTGGIVLVTAEIVPEQLYERQWDAYLGIHDPAFYPNFMRDYLDPEKVEVVQNQYVDVLHAQPTATFGYAPLNHAWKRSITRVGGKFYRPNPDTFVEDRQRFWSADQTNPTLTDDFYMVSDLPHSVFADTASDAFEVLTLGNVGIVGNTVFGDGLDEDTNSYEEIMEQVDTGRIVQTPVPLPSTPVTGETS